MGKMGKIRIKIRLFEDFPSAVLFLLGFLTGMLLPNLLWKMQWRQETLTSFYLLGAFAGKGNTGKEYFTEVFRRRGSFFLLCALCGFSVFGAPLAVISMIGMGVVTGAILTMSILQFGFVGGAAGLSLLFPHYVVYLPVMMYFCRQVFDQSRDIWKNYGIFPQKNFRYILRILLSGSMYMGGVLLEAFVNPAVVERILKMLKFF